MEYKLTFCKCHCKDMERSFYMKKLFGFLLVMALVIMASLPVFAMNSEYDLQINPNVTAVNLGARVVKDEIYDEETKEFIGYGPEWTCYPWTNYCMVEIVLDGKTLTVPLDSLGSVFADRYGQNFSGGIQDSQSAETPWEVGGTYDARYYIFDSDKKEDNVVWEMNLKVTLTEPGVDLQISDVTVDELTGSPSTDENGNPIKFYRWERSGKLDVTIDGVEHKNITLEQFQNIFYEENNEDVYFSYYYIYEGDVSPDDQHTHPWKVGDTYTVHVDIRSESQYLYEGNINISLCETNIESITAKPVTYYAHEGSARIELTSHYKDGTSGPCELDNWNVTERLPEEPGTYTVTVLVSNTIEVPVEVTVLPTPTSGVLGENVTWTFDAETSTLTVSGSGDTYFVGMNEETATEDFRDWTQSWASLVLHFLPKNVIVEEGITGLMPTFMAYAPAVEHFVLPNTLTSLPLLVFGYNGPSSVLDIGLGYETTGVNTFIVPQSITAWNELSFYQCWGINHIYLPEGIQSINLENLVYTLWFYQLLGVDATEVTIHFAGTEAEWNEITFFVPEVDPEMTDGTATGLTLEQAQELLKTVNIVFEDPSETYEVAEDSIIIEDGTATVPDSVVDIVEGEDVIIDITVSIPGEDEIPGENDEPAQAPKVESVIIGSSTFDKIANAETTVEIKLPNITVSFDKEAIGVIGEQAADKDVIIIATEVNEETLTVKQKVADT